MQQQAPSFVRITHAAQPRQPRLERARERERQQQRIDAPAEARIGSLCLMTEPSQQCDAVAAHNRQWHHVPAFAGQQRTSPWLAEKLQPVAPFLQQPQRGHAEHHVTHPRPQSYQQRLRRHQPGPRDRLPTRIPGIIEPRARR